MTNANRKVVMGLGNTLNRDEGLGVHALKALEERLHPALGETAGESTLELLDGGTLGLSLLPIVEEASHLLILDATNTNQPPGTVIELRREEIPLYRGVKLSEHQVTFQEVLGLASFRGKLPEHLHLIGAQPADLSIGVELSPEIAAVIPHIVERALNVLQSWGVLDETPPASSDRIHELQEQIAGLKKSWPAHSTPPGMLQRLEDLEEQLENELKKT